MFGSLSHNAIASAALSDAGSLRQEQPAVPESG